MIPWCDCNWIYALVNVKRNHWILLALNLGRHEFVYYDSLPTYTTEVEIDDMLAPVRDCVSYLLANSNLYDSVERRPTIIPQYKTTISIVVSIQLSFMNVL